MLALECPHYALSMYISRSLFATSADLEASQQHVRVLLEPTWILRWRRVRKNVPVCSTLRAAPQGGRVRINALCMPNTCYHSSNMARALSRAKAHLMQSSNRCTQALQQLHPPSLSAFCALTFTSMAGTALAPASRLRVLITNGVSTYY